MCVDSQWINCTSPLPWPFEPEDVFLSGQKTGFEDVKIIYHARTNFKIYLGSTYDGNSLPEIQASMLP